MLSRLFLTISLLSLAGVSFVSIGNIVTETPAFSPSARHEGISGDWRVPGHWEMYHQGRYLHELGLGFLRADQTSSGVTEGPDSVADPDIAKARAAMAAEFFRESLRLSPGQAEAWTSLAWSEALQGNIEEAKTELEISWKVAPFNVSQAGSRLTLAELLSDFDESGTLFDELAEKGTINDLKVIKRFRNAQFNDTLAYSERYLELAKRASLTP